MNKMLFQLGGVIMTPGAWDLMAIEGLDPVHYLARHVTGDWGDLDEEDKRANDQALRDGSRILSAYGRGDNRLWIITETDRSLTTILRPQDY